MKNIFKIFLLFISLGFIASSCDNREGFYEPQTTPIDYKFEGDTLGVIDGNYEFFLKVLNFDEKKTYQANVEFVKGSGNLYINSKGELFKKDQVITSSNKILFEGPVGDYELKFRVRNGNTEFTKNWRFKIIAPDLLVSSDAAIDNDSCKVGVNHTLTFRSLYPKNITVQVILGSEFKLVDANSVQQTTLNFNAFETKTLFLVPQLTASFQSNLIPFVHKSLVSEPTFRFFDGQKDIEKKLRFTIFDNLPAFETRMTGRGELNTSNGLHSFFLALGERPKDRDAKWNTSAQNNNITSRFLNFENLQTFCSPLGVGDYMISTLNTVQVLAANTQGCQGGGGEAFRIYTSPQNLTPGQEVNLTSNAAPQGNCTCCSGNPIPTPYGNFGGTSVGFVRLRAVVRHTDSQGATTDQIVNIEFSR